MSKIMMLPCAAIAGAVAVGGFGIVSAQAADIPAPEAQLQPPPGYYGVPPVEESYAYPPPVAYAYPPPPPYYAYVPPPVVVVPGPYYRRPLYAYRYRPYYAHYGYWHRGYRRW